MNLKRLVFAAIITMLPFSAYAHGRHHHHRHVRHRHHAVHPLDIRPHMQANAGRMLRVAEHYVGARHSPDGFRGPWCGSFLGFVADRAGISKPRDYRLARAWAHAGPRTAPRPGSIIVMPHHVGLVAEVDGNRALVLSGNHGHKVGWGWYAIRRAIAFVWPV